MLQARVFRDRLALGLPSRDEDVLTAKRMLKDIGRLDEPSVGFSPLFDRDLDDTVRGLQEDNGLLVDGLLTPGGPSERNMRRDAGDLSSANDVSQDWMDVSGSGNPDEFHRGTLATADTNDPTFQGVPGNLSKDEYWLSDGDDFFEYGAANETWMDNLHRDDATFTAVQWWYAGGVANDQRFWDTGNASSGAIGVGMFSTSSRQINMTGGRGAGLTIDLNSTAALFNLNEWNMVAVALDEAAGAAGSDFFGNGVTEAFDGTYNTPNASAATNRLHIGSDGTEATQMPNGGRVAVTAFWDRKLSPTQLNRIFTATRDRFGI